MKCTITAVVNTNTENKPLNFNLGKVDEDQLKNGNLATEVALLLDLKQKDSQQFEKIIDAIVNAYMFSKTVDYDFSKNTYVPNYSGVELANTYSGPRYTWPTAKDSIPPTLVLKTGNEIAEISNFYITRISQNGKSFYAVPEYALEQYSHFLLAQQTLKRLNDFKINEEFEQLNSESEIDAINAEQIAEYQTLKQMRKDISLLRSSLFDSKTDINNLIRLTKKRIDKCKSLIDLISQYLSTSKDFQSKINASKTSLSRNEKQLNELPPNSTAEQKKVIEDRIARWKFLSFSEDDSAKLKLIQTLTTTIESLSKDLQKLENGNFPDLIIYTEDEIISQFDSAYAKLIQDVNMLSPVVQTKITDALKKDNSNVNLQSLNEILNSDIKDDFEFGMKLLNYYINNTKSSKKYMNDSMLTLLKKLAKNLFQESYSISQNRIVNLYEASFLYSYTDPDDNVRYYLDFDKLLNYYKKKDNDRKEKLFTDEVLQDEYKLQNLLLRLINSEFIPNQSRFSRVNYKAIKTSKKGKLRIYLNESTPSIKDILGSGNLGLLSVNDIYKLEPLEEEVETVSDDYLETSKIKRYKKYKGYYIYKHVSQGVELFGASQNFLTSYQHLNWLTSEDELKNYIDSIEDRQTLSTFDTSYLDDIIETTNVVTPNGNFYEEGNVISKLNLRAGYYGHHRGTIQTIINNKYVKDSNEIKEKLSSLLDDEETLNTIINELELTNSSSTLSDWMLDHDLFTEEGTYESVMIRALHTSQFFKQKLTYSEFKQWVHETFDSSLASKIIKTLDTHEKQSYFLHRYYGRFNDFRSPIYTQLKNDIISYLERLSNVDKKIFAVVSTTVKQHQDFNYNNIIHKTTVMPTNYTEQDVFTVNKAEKNTIPASATDNALFNWKVIQQVFERHGIKMELLTKEEYAAKFGKNKPTRGYTIGGTIYIVTDYAQLTTPLHEYTHILLSILKATNNQKYSDLIAKYASIKSNIDELIENKRKKYENLSEEDLIEEIFCDDFGSYLLNRNPTFESMFTQVVAYNDTIFGTKALNSIEDLGKYGVIHFFQQFYSEVRSAFNNTGYGLPITSYSNMLESLIPVKNSNMQNVKFVDSIEALEKVNNTSNNDSVLYVYCE